MACKLRLSFACERDRGGWSPCWSAACPAFGLATANRPPAATLRGDAKVFAMPIREYPPLCLTGTLAGGGPTRLGVDRRLCLQNALCGRGWEDPTAWRSGGP